MSRSHPFHEAVDHTLFAGLVERDGELVAVDGGDVAVAELLVKHALADREIGDRAGGLGDQLALDGEGKARARAAAAEAAGLPGPSLFGRRADVVHAVV